MGIAKRVSVEFATLDPFLFGVCACVVFVMKGGVVFKDEAQPNAVRKLAAVTASLQQSEMKKIASGF